MASHTRLPRTAAPRRRIFFRARLSPDGRARDRAATYAPDDSFFREMVSSMRNGVLAIRNDGTIAVMNQEAYRIFGLAPKEADIGLLYTDVLQSLPDVVRVLANAFELSHLPNRVEMRLKSTGRVIGYTLSHVRDAAGGKTGLAFFFKDLTQVEQLEERERLRDRLAALGQMAAGIAHELKNPLAGIEVMAGLLRRRVPDSPDAQSILTDIINEAKMANATVVEILDYVRPVRLQNDRIALAEVVHASLVTAESKAVRGEVVVNTRIPDDLPYVHGDRHQLCQVVTNLLINAFEALGGRGTVWISGDRDTLDAEAGQTEGLPRAAVVLQVADDGPGVPPEMVDHIFNPFFTTKAQGSGLGLAIVRKIVDAHDGRIDIRSAPGSGTRFMVTLPAMGGDDQTFGTLPIDALERNE
jgi:PAS domain S-box-containing protein